MGYSLNCTKLCLFPPFLQFGERKMSRPSFQQKTEYCCIRKSHGPHKCPGDSPMMIPCLQTSSILGSYPRVDRLYSDEILLILYQNLSFFLSCSRWEERLPHSTSMSWDTLMVFDASRALRSVSPQNSGNCCHSSYCSDCASRGRLCGANKYHPRI